MPNGTVLVVDDDEGIRAFLQEALMDESYDVALASDGVAALAVVASMTPCVILLDMVMPVMDGWAFARQYRRRAGVMAAPLVCMAASHAAQHAQEIAAEGWLAKPFDLDELFAVVARLSHASPNAAESAPASRHAGKAAWPAP